MNQDTVLIIKVVCALLQLLLLPRALSDDPSSSFALLGQLLILAFVISL